MAAVTRDGNALPPSTSGRNAKMLAAVTRSHTPAVTQHKYKMNGMDANNSNRDTWVVTGFVDMTGAQYPNNGPLTKPLRDVHVADISP